VSKNFSKVAKKQVSEKFGKVPADPLADRLRPHFAPPPLETDFGTVFGKRTEVEKRKTFSKLFPKLFQSFSKLKTIKF
jgi:hypothetical protein